MMHSSYIWQDGYENMAADGHTAEGQAHDRRLLLPYRQKPNAAASLATTPSDYARFIITLLAPAQNQHIQLSAAGIAAMLTPQVQLTDQITWGLGWGLQQYEEHLSFWHHGRGLFTNFVIGFPEYRTGLVVMTNSGENAQAEHLIRTIIQAVFGEDYPVFYVMPYSTMKQQGFVI